MPLISSVKASRPTAAAGDRPAASSTPDDAPLAQSGDAAANAAAKDEDAAIEAASKYVAPTPLPLDHTVVPGAAPLPVGTTRAMAGLLVDIGAKAVSITVGRTQGVPKAVVVFFSLGGRMKALTLCDVPDQATIVASLNLVRPPAGEKLPPLTEERDPNG